MNDEFLMVIREILESSISDLGQIHSEKIIQDLIKSRLLTKGVVMDSRVILESEEYPNMEVDLLGKGRAIELKVNPKFYDGVGQILSLKELYALDVMLIQVWQGSLDDRVVRAMDRLTRRLGFTSILVDLKRRKVIVFGR